MGSEGDHYILAISLHQFVTFITFITLITSSPHHFAHTNTLLDVV
jgi:hypothetical protein